MTEQLNPEHEPKHAVGEPETTTDGQTAPEPVDVEALQAEAAEARTRGDAAFEGWKAAALRIAAGDLLQAVDHMPTDDPRYYDDAGFPSPEGMREVATELVSARPYLAKVRGEIHQAPQQKEEPVPTFGDLARQAMGLQ